LFYYPIRLVSDHDWNMLILYGIHTELGVIRVFKDIEKVQMRATKLVQGTYYKTPQVQRETYHYGSDAFVET